MRADATQHLTDGEIFYIIENGVRFTGMPAFGTGKSDPAGDKQVWELVYLVRHLPRITAGEDRMDEDAESILTPVGVTTRPTFAFGNAVTVHYLFA